MKRKKLDPKQAARTATYKERQQARGLKQIQIWIPEEEEANIRRYIERKRRAFLAAGPKVQI